MPCCNRNLETLFLYLQNWWYSAQYSMISIKIKTIIQMYTYLHRAIKWKWIIKICTNCFVSSWSSILFIFRIIIRMALFSSLVKTTVVKQDTSRKLFDGKINKQIKLLLLFWLFDRHVKINLNSIQFLLRWIPDNFRLSWILCGDYFVSVFKSPKANWR